MDRLNVLVVEDGDEYTTTLGRFAGDVLDLTRAGDGAAALRALAAAPFDVLFLDMRFDRVPPGALLGDMGALVERFGDAVRARAYLEVNQGAYVLAAVREAGHQLPAVFSYDFDGSPARWEAIRAKYAPVAYLPDNASAAEIRSVLLGIGRGTGPS